MNTPLIDAIKRIELEISGKFNLLEIATCIAYNVWQRQTYHERVGYIKPEQELHSVVSNSPLFKPATYNLETKLVLKIMKAHFDHVPTQIRYDENVDWTQFMAALSAYNVQQNYHNQAEFYVNFAKQHKRFVKLFRGLDIDGMFDGLEKDLWQAFQYTMLGNGMAASYGKDQTKEYRGNILGLRMLERYGRNIANIQLSDLIEEARAMVPELEGEKYKQDKYYQRLVKNLRRVH